MQIGYDRCTNGDPKPNANVAQREDCDRKGKLRI